jgi:hypothetical protein
MSDSKEYLEREIPINKFHNPVMAKSSKKLLVSCDGIDDLEVQIQNNLV